MKLNEILEVQELTEEQLNEISTKKIIAAGAIALAAMGLNRHYDNVEVAAAWKAYQAQQAAGQVTVKQRAEYARLQKELDDLAKIVSSKYRHVSDEEAIAIVALAKKYERPDFPKATDLLALMGVESSMNPDAVSKLKKDPAMGLMQVRPIMWGLTPSELRGNIEKQIKSGSDILHKMYKRMGNKEDAIQSYNIGPTALKRGDKDDLEAAMRYLNKYKAEVARYLGA